MAARNTTEPLTRRQREVLDLLVRGRTNFEIAQALGISLDGAKWHVREVLARLGVESREEAADIWRRDRSLLARGLGFAAILAKLTPTRIAVGLSAVAVAAVAAVGVVAIVGNDEDPLAVDASPTPFVAPTPPPGVDDLAPRSGIPIVDEVIDIAKRGDLAAFRALMKEFPEPCTTGLRGVDSPPACPPGAAEGSLVNTFRALASERPNTAVDLDQFLGTFIPGLTRLHGVAVALPDNFDGLFPSWKYEVIVYGTIGTRQVWGEYLLDDSGIVGVWVPGGGFAVSDRAKSVPDADWLVAPYSLARITADEDLYVLGRDFDVTFRALLPPACAGKPIAIRLYEYPPPGVAGGIQTPSDPALATELRVIAGRSGDTRAVFHLPPSAQAPTRVRPGLLSPCLSEIAVQGELNIALLAGPADSGVAVIEMPGATFDLPRNLGQAGVETMGEYLRELTSSVDGYACDTVSLTDPAARNARGNVVFRIGEASQQQPCRVPGKEIVFVMTGLPFEPVLGPAALSDRPLAVPGVVQLLRNIGPEPPHREPRPPLIRLD